MSRAKTGSARGRCGVFMPEKEKFPVPLFPTLAPLRIVLKQVKVTQIMWGEMKLLKVGDMLV